MDPSHSDDTEYDNFLRRHTNQNNRRMHVAGWLLSILTVIYSIFTFSITDIFYVIPFVLGFTFAGHFFFEGDSMSCSNPKVSLMCQLRLVKEILTRKR